MTRNREWFEDFKEPNSRTNIYLGDDRGYQIKGYCNIPIVLPDGNVRHIHNVMYVRGIKKNPIFVSTITDQNLKVDFYKSYCVVKDLLDCMKPITSSICVGGLYKLNVKSAPHQALASSDMTTMDLWNQRFGHINYNDLLLLQKTGMVEGLLVLKYTHIDCDARALGKFHRVEFLVNPDKKKRDVLELVHTNLCGPMKTRSLGGAYYFSLFIDDYAGFTWVYFFKKKSNTFEYFKEFRRMVEKKTSKCITILCSDQGGECKKACVLKYCKDNGIQQRFTVPHSPQQNGVAERKNN